MHLGAINLFWRGGKNNYNAEFQEAMGCQHFVHQKFGGDEAFGCQIDVVFETFPYLYL